MILLFILATIFTTTLSTFDHSYRLPETCHPTKYTLDFSLDELQNDQIEGITKIDVKCDKKVKEITLHVNEESVTVKSVYVNSALLSSSTNKQRETITIGLDKEMSTFQLTFKHSSKIGEVDARKSDKKTFSSGIYRSTSSPTNIQTMFEFRGARKTFPCFDEPGMKAVFEMKFNLGDKIDKNVNVISVTKEKHVSSAPNFDFRPTSTPIAPYLFAFAIGKFTEKCDGIVCVYYDKDNSKSDTWADGRLEEFIKFTQATFKEIEHKLGKFEMPPLRIALVPLPFLGAMEHGGLMFFDSFSNCQTNGQCSAVDGYLVYPRMAVTAEEVKTAQLPVHTNIAHELMHYWFGNLVSPKYWDDLWLSEAIASFMQKLLFDGTAESLQQPDEFVGDECIWDLCDEIICCVKDKSYSKSCPSINGRSVSNTNVKGTVKQYSNAQKQAQLALTTFVNIYGFDQLLQAMEMYLKTYANKAATTDDLLAVVDKVVKSGIVRTPHGMKPSNLLGSLLKQNSFPVVTVSFDIKAKEFTFEQTPYVGNGRKWYAPVVYETSAGKKNVVWTTPEHTSKTIDCEQILPTTPCTISAVRAIKWRSPNHGLVLVVVDDGRVKDDACDKPRE